MKKLRLGFCCENEVLIEDSRRMGLRGDPQVSERFYGRFRTFLSGFERSMRVILQELGDLDGRFEHFFIKLDIA